MIRSIFFLSALLTTNLFAADLKKDLDIELVSLMEKVVEWRHDIHQNPELAIGNLKPPKKLLITLNHSALK